MKVVSLNCNHPLKLFWTDPYLTPDGQTKYRFKVCSPDVHHIELVHGSWVPQFSNFVDPCSTRISDTFTPIPCGQCIECRLQHSREWANRLMAEASYYDSDTCWFVTLTYDDENVPVHYTGLADGKAVPALSLCKKDVQDFFKRLRYYKGPLRFYLAGEYGDHTFRPHYHAVIFGLSLDPEQLPLWSRTALNFSLFESLELEKIWSKGRVVVSPVSWDTCCYVSRYVTKKLTGRLKEKYKLLNIEPEFAVMSRKPGIGKQWALDHPAQVKNGFCYLSTAQDGIEFSSPRYFRNLFVVDDDLEKLYNNFVIEDRFSNDLSNIKSISDLARSDLTSYFDRKEASVKDRIKSLKRSSF